jgi:hypothetical protein
LFSILRPKGHSVSLNLVFYFSDFTLSQHERSRLATTINKLFEEGKLTRSAAREKHFICAFLVRKLASDLFTHALTYGAINWDVTLAKTLSTVLTASLAPRTGDVTVAPLDVHKVPYLAYQDIKLKLVKGRRIFFRQARWGGPTVPSQKGANRILRLSSRLFALSLECAIRISSSRGQVEFHVNCRRDASESNNPP